MGFLRRLLGGAPAADDAARAPAPPVDAATAAAGASPELDEQERERELLRADPAQTSDELIQRQLRYADRSWTPPAQGGLRRAGDEEQSED